MEAKRLESLKQIAAGIAAQFGDKFEVEMCIRDSVELVGDDDQGLAVGLHVAHDGEQLVRLLRGQHGGGLVQNQNIGTCLLYTSAAA